jgi:hypothetical protein
MAHPIYIGGCRSGKTVAGIAEKLIESVDASIYGHQAQPLAIEKEPNPLRWYDKPYPNHMKEH